MNKPAIFKRKEAKGYGGKKMIEGLYKSNDSILLIEDVVVSGSGIIEATQDLKTQNLRVSDVITLLDRQQGGPKNTKKHGINFHSILKADDLLQYLYKKGKINKKAK